VNRSIVVFLAVKHQNIQDNYSHTFKNGKYGMENRGSLDRMIKKLPKPKGRDAIKAWNHNKIIEASIEVVAKYGIAGTTISRVVALADVSRGLINIHFKSKEILLKETLNYMFAAYNHTVDTAVKKAGPNPVDQIKAIVTTDFDPKILNKKNMGVWFAFRAQIRSMPEHLEMVETRDTSLTNHLIRICEALNSKGNYGVPVTSVVRGFMVMLEGYWLDFHLHPRNYDREEAKNTCLLFLSGLFPKHF
jgi:TetR/AcrR family transcriptional regulator, transcriptional repressor of bet genes